MAEAEVWRRLRAGELLGRTDRGQLFVLDDSPTGTVSGSATPASEASTDLPPLPGSDPMESLRSGASAHALTPTPQPSQEIALLLDHLSLAKEENREILRMTQESIRKVTELSESLVAMKDSVIESKDAQLTALREQLASRESKIKELLQQKEDLEMLARALAAPAPK